MITSVAIDPGGLVRALLDDGVERPSAVVVEVRLRSRASPGSGPLTGGRPPPATSSSSAGKRVITSQPSSVTTSCSSIRAADQPSEAGQNVSSAKTIPSSIISGWSKETSRLKIGFSQIESPTPCPYWSANAASSSGKPNSCAFGQTSTTSAVRRHPGRISEIAWSRMSRQRL